MVVEQLQEIFAPNEVDLARLQSFGRQFIRFAGNCGLRAQYFARLADADDQGFAVGGIHGQLHASLAKHIDAARVLTLHEQDRIPRVGRGEFHVDEGIERWAGQLAEEAILPHRARLAIFDQFHSVRDAHVILLFVLNPAACVALRSVSTFLEGMQRL
jgi:hypothetical protein